MGNTLGTALNKVKVIAYCPARFFCPLAGIKKPLVLYGNKGFLVEFPSF